MKHIIRRLNRLEAAIRTASDGPWDWRAKADEVKRRAFAALSAEESAWLTDLYERGHAREGEIWDRFVNAFNRAVEEVPAPYLMCTADLFGEW
jgi:hypothetical protein